MTKFFAAAILAALTIPSASAQAPCPTLAGATLTGTVRDPTQALIPGATLTLDNKRTTTSGSDGQFRFPCVPDGPHHLAADAPGFAHRDLSLTTPHTAQISFLLKPEDVQTSVEVDADEVTVPSPTSTGPSQTISGTRLQSLADDPDDLLRELQQMAAAAGGSPSNASISIDGFQGSDSGTTLPPKSSIAYIKVNPDLFSSEYRNPPFGGGQVQIYTKPGQPTFHGALFLTNGSAWMNARDPFSPTSAPLGKQRYGFELNGPIRKKGSDFTVTLEHRSIDNFAVVNAITVNAAGTQSPIVQDVPDPQRLWVGTARIDWQLGPKNTFIASSTTNVNHLENVGVGGTSLAETGYNDGKYYTDIHLTDVTTISPKLMHEVRFGTQFDGETDTPNSTAPQIQVAGAFTGGGNALGNTRTREIYAEIDDDAILSTTNHLLKFGTQIEILRETPSLPTNFNGAYTFGGGVLPNNTTITGIQQYVLALNNQPGGAPTDFSNVTGNPNLTVHTIRAALFVQDSWKINQNLTFAYGLRYFNQNNPTILNNVMPRFGLSWSPDKKATWTFHAHAGLFNGRFLANNWAQIVRMDGVQRITSTVYNPSSYCSTGITPTCTPFANATAIQSIRTVQPNLSNLFYGIENLGFTHAFPHGWNLSADYYLTQMWHNTRTENINAPLNASPTGPRPGPANLDIFQMNNSGRGYGNVVFVGLEQHSIKRLQFFMGAVRVDIVDDADDSPFFTPQTTGVNAGEYARRDNNPLWNVFGNATLTLPKKIQLSANFNAQGLAPYNITTGFDNNGDGNFNDRPQYAPAGTPSCATVPAGTTCGYPTPWGLLVNSGGIGSLPRNKGTMPWTVYLDTNLQRAFKLTRNPKAEHQQVLTANIRSSNVLNHTNVTSVGSVLGSPLFGVPYAADNGRRIEAGLRYAF
jgi:hypothetical protein